MVSLKSQLVRADVCLLTRLHFRSLYKTSFPLAKLKEAVFVMGKYCLGNSLPMSSVTVLWASSSCLRLAIMQTIEMQTCLPALLQHVLHGLTEMTSQPSQLGGEARTEYWPLL
mmetsp:Transcript_3169/g.6553  ORF Transcript_3169/g.6553 Transcript_3169/m.6553 type:complete len:113 (-) Transcript_3169:843-1181(-)